MSQLPPKSQFLRWLFSFLVFSIASHAMALQLGRPQIQSRLGEPLKLEVQISELSAQEAQEFQANLASTTVYQAAQINRVGGLDNVAVTLVRKGDEVYLMQFQGTQAITDSYVDLLIEFRWATGRAFHNLGFPLGTGQAPETAVATNNDTSSPNTAPLPAQKPAAVAPPPRPAPLPTPPKETVAKTESKPKPDSAVVKKPGATIEVVKGDTASNLVMTYSSEGDVSLDQLLISLLRNNPKAFVENNVNRLKAGALISLPTEEDAASIDRKQARADIRLQALDFDAYRSQLAGQTGKTKLADANERESQGGLKGQVQNKAEKSPDQLKLSKPGTAEADQVKEKLESDQAAQRNQEVSKNVSELDSISQSASKMQDGMSTNLSNLPAFAQDFGAWLKHYMFEVIAGIAIIAALLVSLSLLRDKRRQAPDTLGDDPDLDFKAGPGPSPDTPQEMHIDFDLDLVQPHSAPVPQPKPTPPPAPPPAFNASYHPSAPATSKGNVAPLSEDPFQVRLDLADELWKLGQRQTGRALAQEVADQTHGETRERALRWLQERT
jgi:pilus assembly protein FimV